MISKRMLQVILTFVSIGILAGIIWFSNPAKLAGYLSGANFWYIGAGFCISTVGVFLRVLKWRVLLKNVKYWTVFPIQLFSCALSNFTPGKIADPIKSVLLKLRSKKDVSATLGSVIWERILDVIVLIIFSVIGMQFIGISSEFYMLSWIGIILFVVLVAVLIAVMNSRKMGMKIFRFVKKLPLLKRISDEFIETFYGSRTQKRRIFAGFVVTIIPWVIEGFIVYFAFMAIGIELNPFILAGMVAISTVVGIASFLPGGLGSFEAVLILLISISGVDAGIAAAGVLLSRMMAYWYGAFLGGLSFVYLSRKIEIRKYL